MHLLSVKIKRLLFKAALGLTAAALAMFFNKLFRSSFLFSLQPRSSLVLTSFRLMSAATTSSMSTPKPVIVVGSGLAGLAAAHEAIKAGAEVKILERAAKPGGNSIKASSGINGAGTRFQKQAGISKDELFYEDTIKSAGKRFTAGHSSQTPNRKELIDTLTDRSAQAVEFLVDELGVDLSVVAPLGGHSVPRTHRGSGKMPPGAAIVTTLLKQLEGPKFQLVTSADVKSLVVTDGAVAGVEYTHEDKTETLQGPVVFAAGGFAGDTHGLLAKHRPDLAGLPSTNDERPAAHDILSAVGAEFVDMDSVQVHPTGFVDPQDRTSLYKFLAAEMLRGEGDILLSGATGKRFVNELDTREVVSQAIMETLTPEEQAGNGAIQWDVTLLQDPGACEAGASHLGFYLFKGLMEKKKVGDLSPEVIASIDNYAAAVAGGKDEEFGRVHFGRWNLKAGKENRDAEVCVGKVTPVVHFTMGGAVFNGKAQVLGRDATTNELVPVQGLWAAGEITGGIHGDNRLGGSSLLECVVFGREAGQQAAKHVVG